MKFLIADIMHESLFYMLDDIHILYDYKPSITRAEIKQQIGEYDGLIIRSKTRVDADLLENSSRLKIVARAGAGIDNLDEQELEQRGIRIVNAPEGNMNAVAEHTLSLLLALLNNVVKGHREICSGTWDREGNRGYELSGRTVGIIGYGFMGMSFARKLASMDCRVIAYDKYKTGYSDTYCQESTMEQLYREADILSLHIPLTSETRALVTYSFLASFAKPLFLLNTSRGEIVSQEDLLKALGENKIIGAGLDVLENEKFASLTSDQKKILEELCANDRVILTPHVAGWTFESYVRINEVLCRKIKSSIDHLS
jgi:D-3-phosphoglycerate dehydrogenase